MTEKVLIPDVIEPEEKLPADLIALRRFARLMDEAFQVPGTKFRFGLDAVLGLIPGIGDVIGGVMSAWIIVGAVRHRVPMWVVARMVLNVAIDLIFGAVPVAGDVFDFLFEENMKNMRLLEKYRGRTLPPRSSAQMTGIAVLIIGSILFLAILIMIGLLSLVFWLIGQR